MGHGSFTSSAWDAYSTTIKSKPTTGARGVFSASKIHETLDPKNIILRESRDSEDSPNSMPVAIFMDVTGSMGMIPDYMARTGLKTLFEEIYARKPGGGQPAVLFGAIGDLHYDRSPLQLSQFESSNILSEQLEKLHLEGGGGGNNSESYNLPWYAAATRFAIDSMAKRKVKGTLITIGDEEPPPPLTQSDLTKVFGPGQYPDVLTNEQLLEMVSANFNVFHVVVEQGHHCHGNADFVVKEWQKVLGQRVVRLSDYTKLSEVIVSVLEMVNGSKDAATVSKSWSGDTSLVVSKALSSLVASTSKSDGASAVAF